MGKTIAKKTSIVFVIKKHKKNRTQLKHLNIRYLQQSI